MDSKDIFHKRFEEKLRAEGWTEAAFGEKAGIASSLVGRYKRRENTPTLDVIDKIAAVWGLSAGEFLAPKEPPAPRVERPAISDELRAEVISIARTTADEIRQGAGLPADVLAFARRLAALDEDQRRTLLAGFSAAVGVAEKPAQVSPPKQRRK